MNYTFAAAVAAATRRHPPPTTPLLRPLPPHRRATMGVYIHLSYILTISLPLIHLSYRIVTPFVFFFSRAKIFYHMFFIYNLN